TERSAEIDRRIEELQTTAPDPAGDPEYQRLVSEKESLESAVRLLQENRAEALSELKQQADAIDDQLYYLGIDLSAFTQREQGLARIAELEQQQKQLAAEFERLEEELHLCDEF